jgi:diadenosine tetraphosphate (Ap4A) HIT family hydrolase
MSPNTPASDRPCIFCAIATGEGEASVVYEDDGVVVFMDRFPVTPGHLLVIPRTHSVGLEDLDASTSARVWSVGHAMARALRRSTIRSEGINILVCDGQAAFQSVLHFHLHVIPRSVDDGWTLLTHEPPERDRSLLDDEASAIRRVLHAENA